MEVIRSRETSTAQALPVAQLARTAGPMASPGRCALAVTGICRNVITETESNGFSISPLDTGRMGWQGLAQSIFPANEVVVKRAKKTAGECNVSFGIRTSGRASGLMRVGSLCHEADHVANICKGNL